jgi:hypothetical protein
MAAVSSSRIKSGYLGGLRAQLVALLNQILGTIALNYTAGQRTLTAATSATNPSLGASAGSVNFTSAVGGTYRAVTAATYPVVDADWTIVANRAGTVTLTLPDPTAYPGRVLDVRTITAHTVVSAGSNVVPRIGGAAGTAILAATAGAWARLQSDGTSWQIIAGS